MRGSVSSGGGQRPRAWRVGVLGAVGLAFIAFVAPPGALARTARPPGGDPVASPDLVTALSFSRGDVNLGLAPKLQDLAISAATGDVNGDTKLDIVALRYDGRVVVLLNQGSGSFQTSTVVPSTFMAGASAIAPGDLDRDGDLDLVVAGPSVVAFLGQGDGSFPASACSRAAATAGRPWPSRT